MEASFSGAFSMRWSTLGLFVRSDLSLSSQLPIGVSLAVLYVIAMSLIRPRRRVVASIYWLRRHDNTFLLADAFPALSGSVQHHLASGTRSAWNSLQSLPQYGSVPRYFPWVGRRSAFSFLRVELRNSVGSRNSESQIPQVPEFRPACYSDRQARSNQPQGKQPGEREVDE